MAREHGRIKRWLADRGFGFIVDDNGRDVFAHISALRRGAGLVPIAGEGCYFEREDAPKGPRATNVVFESDNL